VDIDRVGLDEREFATCSSVVLDPRADLATIETASLLPGSHDR
jgi:hypothetical protein